MNNFCRLCLPLLILYGIKLTETEIFTSLVEVEELFETETIFINSFEEYLLVQGKNLEYFKLTVQEHKIERKQQVSGKNITLYVLNPINAYLLMKRLSFDWRCLQDLMSHYDENSFLENVAKYRNILKFPSVEDLRGAAHAVLRLQNIYNLKTSRIAEGQFNGVQYSTEMTSDDCLVLGLSSLQVGDTIHRILWMDEAEKRSAYGPKYKIKNTHSEMLLELPDLISFDKYFVFQKSIETIKYDSGFSAFQNADQNIYEMMCSGELKPNSRQLRPLRCHYVTNNVQFLRIAPLKRETVSISPFIVIYHEAMYDNEIDFVKEIAKPQLISSPVINMHTNLPDSGSLRALKTAHIKNEENKAIQNIVQRTKDMTGLNMETAENLEVANYGIAGHMVPHCDFDMKWNEEAYQGPHTNRIATVLYYLSDVEQGGATVFTEIQTVIFPKKGAAVFWYNLYASGEKDYRTMHAGCPILNGCKWVANKWIGERGQEFTRQCDIIPDHPRF